MFRPTYSTKLKRLLVTRTKLIPNKPDWAIFRKLGYYLILIRVQKWCHVGLRLAIDILDFFAWRQFGPLFKVLSDFLNLLVILPICPQQ
jgi:hypothetical protein